MTSDSKEEICFVFLWEKVYCFIPSYCEIFIRKYNWFQVLLDGLKSSDVPSPRPTESGDAAQTHPVVNKVPSDTGVQFLASSDPSHTFRQHADEPLCQLRPFYVAPKEQNVTVHSAQWRGSLVVIYGSPQTTTSNTSGSITDSTKWNTSLPAQRVNDEVSQLTSVHL